MEVIKILFVYDILNEDGSFKEGLPIALINEFMNYFNSLGKYRMYDPIYVSFAEHEPIKTLANNHNITINVSVNDSSVKLEVNTNE